jgi:hypothetical protein
VVRVGDEVSISRIGDPALKHAKCFFAALAFVELAWVEGQPRVSLRGVPFAADHGSITAGPLVVTPKERRVNRNGSAEGVATSSTFGGLG